MDRTKRITLLTESATLLSKREPVEIDLILEQFGCNTEQYWPNEAHAYCLEMLKGASDADLKELHLYLTGEQPDAKTASQPWVGGSMRIFFSHLVAEKVLVGKVKGILSAYGIDAFVAHDSIEPSEEWVSVIDAALTSCDAGVAFLHPKFIESKWCDQEVGFMLARRVPVLPIMFGTSPYGFLGQYQGFKATKDGKVISAEEIAEAILEWLKTSPNTQAAFTEGLVAALEVSISWNRTRALWPLLSSRTSFTPDQLRRMETAALTNVDVKEAFIGASQAPELIRQLVAKHS